MLSFYLNHLDYSHYKKVQITIDFSATDVKESIIYVQWESNGMSFHFYDT